MHTTKITQTLALAGCAPAGKLSHTYCGLLPVMALLVATLGKLRQGKRACAVLALCAATAMALPAQTFTSLFSFGGNLGGPQAGLVQATNGEFYGTANAVFKITSTGTLTWLFRFDGADGLPPVAGLIQATNRDFYGTTYAGGANLNIFGLGAGTIFKITPSGTLTTLYSFCSQSGCTDGSNPQGGLVQATNGDFYGTTALGGAYGAGGTVFKITPGGTLTTLYSFCALVSCPDGYSPAGLVQATNGDFYGTTYGGGAHEGGTIFKITPSGALTTLYSFCAQSGCIDGEFPQAAPVQATNGNFYGTTSGGGANGNYGTVFEITPSGALTTLYSFCSQSGCTDGTDPVAGLVQATNGNFYGTTEDGGANGNYGTVFEIAPSGALTTLHSFDGADGEGPGALVQATDGNFYGTTGGGGASGDGTVFSLSIGLGPFVETQPTFGEVGQFREILGTDLTGATSVSFNGTAAAFSVMSPSLIAARIPAGATSGTVQVVTPSGTLSSNVPFRVVP